MHRNIKIHKYSSLEDPTYHPSAHLEPASTIQQEVQICKYRNTNTQYRKFLKQMNILGQVGGEKDNSLPDINILSDMIFPLATLSEI